MTQRTFDFVVCGYHPEIWSALLRVDPALVPPALAVKHGHSAGDTPSDALLEHLARRDRASPLIGSDPCSLRPAMRGGGVRRCARTWW